MSFVPNKRYLAWIFIWWRIRILLLTVHKALLRLGMSLLDYHAIILLNMKIKLCICLLCDSVKSCVIIILGFHRIRANENLAPGDGGRCLALQRFKFVQ